MDFFFLYLRPCVIFGTNFFFQNKDKSSGNKKDARLERDHRNLAPGLLPYLNVSLGHIILERSIKIT